tara:strand:- start:331 stop:555 length:225 start_codon:yes stop_codon:yes gene_type:complete
MTVLTVIVTFLIIALSFSGGFYIGSKVPSEKIIKQVKRKLKKKDEDTGVIKAPTPKEDKLNKDQEFKKQFPNHY